MAIETQKFIRKPLIVEAVRLTNANFDAVAEWCQGEVATAREGRQSGKKYIKVRVHNPKHPRQTQAFVGDWLLYTEKGYKIYTNKAFRLSFDAYSEVIQGNQEIVPGVTVTDAVEAVRQEQEMSDPRLTGDPVADAETPRRDEQMPSEPAGVVETPVPVSPSGPTRVIQDARLESIAVVPSDPSVESGVGRIEEELHEAKPEQANPHIHEGRVKSDIVETEPGVHVSKSDTAPPPKRDGKRVLSQKEQTQLGPQKVREMITSGQAVLEQDAA
jgi:hypothetical protein